MTNITPKTWKLLTLVAMLLLMAIRLETFVHHDPLLAYANNYDMVRLQSCHQIWPIDQQFPAGKQSPSRPLEFYRKEAANKYKNKCLPSSERLFSSLFSVKHVAPEVFSIRELAEIKSVVTVVTIGALLLMLFQASASLALAAGFIALVLIPDVFNALYLPTFYAEWSAVLGFYLTLVAILLGSIRPQWTIGSLCLFASLVFLGLSKTQHVYIPVLVLLCLLPAVVRQSWRGLRLPLVAVSAAAIVVLIVQTQWMGHERTAAVRKANAINTYLYTVLASSTDPHALAEKLNLPRSCGDYAGLSWYSKNLDRRNLPCTEVFKANRARLLLLPVLDFQAFKVLLQNSDQYLRPIFARNLGQVAGVGFGIASVHRLSIFTLLELPSPLTMGLLLISITGLVASYCLYRLLHCGAPQDDGTACYTAALFISVYPVSGLIVALLGDGYADLAKHSHLAFNGTMTLLLVLGIAMALSPVIAIRQRALNPQQP